MARIQGIRIKNYKTLKDVTLGQTKGSAKDTEPLTPLTVVIGKNGVGKSTLFDVFGFLSDAVKSGVEQACEIRGGYDKIHSRGTEGNIEFEIYYRETQTSVPITYELAIGIDRSGRPIVKSERLRQRRKDELKGQPYSFLYLQDGKGVVWKGEAPGEIAKDTLSNNELKKFMETETADKERIELDDKRRLGITTLGSLKQHPRISKFIKFIEGWYLSYFAPDAVRRALPMAQPQQHLNIHGDNLSNVVQYMEREHRESFQTILNSIAKKIPGISSITTQTTQDGRLLLCFNNTTFKDPFYANQVSDGTLKVFAYLLLLNDPSPSPFLCIEEPENGIYHKLLETLAEEFRNHASKSIKRSQVFITTHQPYFVNALNPDEVWIMEKGEDGFSTLRRASDNPLILNMTEEGIPLGSLWYSDYFDE